MKSYRAHSISDICAIGAVHILENDNSKSKSSDSCECICENEINKYDHAVQTYEKKLESLAKGTSVSLGEAAAEIFESHILLLKDESISGDIISNIKNGMSAQHAVDEAYDRVCRMFESMQDNYMRERAADVRDIKNGLLAQIMDTESDKMSYDVPTVIVAQEIYPSMLLGSEMENVVGIITIKGSVYSHAALLAGMMKIPMLIAADAMMEDFSEGENVILDGIKSQIILSPDTDVVNKMTGYIENYNREQNELREIVSLKTQTKDGRVIALMSNINDESDALRAGELGADGVGLLRTEFMYMRYQGNPDADAQKKEYINVAKSMNGHPVCIRTMDIGSDKMVSGISNETEANPAIGYRGIRLSLGKPDIFKKQLRAILEASAECENIRVMYPMITSAEEYDRIQEIISEVSAECSLANVAYRVPLQGVMIETPASVMIVEELAGRAGFFSIGTNDLTQFTLAMDRTNPDLADIYDTHHPAIMRMIKIVCDAARVAVIPVSVCGDLACDEWAIPQLVDMGVSTLSVPVPELLRVKKSILDI